jgi:hypothetical protein
VTFSSGNYQGEISKHIRLATNDPKHSEIELMVSGHILIDFKLNPDGVMFRNLRRHMEMTREIHIEGEARDRINIVKIESTNDHITATFQSRNENNLRIPYISVKIKPGLPVGRLNAMLTVFTDSPKYPKVPVRIYGEIIGNISVTPQRIDFGFFDKETLPPSKVITLAMEKPDDRFEILGVEDATGALRHDIVCLKEGTQYQLTFHILPGIDKKLINSHVFVRTNYPGEEKIKISVIGGVKPKSPFPKDS